MNGKWIVNIKGSRDSHCEISVLREDNKLGKESYGWMGERKELIYSSGGAHRYEISQFVFDHHVETANLYAQYLNQLEPAP